MDDELRELHLTNAAARAGASAAPVTWKAWIASCGIHLGALGVITISSGLSTPARIGARGGPMTIEAISSRASAGDLNGDALSEVPLDAEVLEATQHHIFENLEMAVAEVVPLPAPPLPAPTDLAQATLPLRVEPLLDDAELAATANDLTPGEESNPAEASRTEPPPPPATVPAPTAANSLGSLPSVGSAGHSGNEGESSPHFAKNSPIPYPVAAVRDRLEGRVLLRLAIDAEGRVSAVEIVESSGFAILDNAAVSGVKAWRAEPARVLGRAVATTAVLPVVFRLR